MENIKNNKDVRINFEEYKIIALSEDIETFEKRLKPLWWENIPLLGSLYCYPIRMAIKASAINRGLLRKEITVSYTIFIFASLIVGYAILHAITPWFTYWINLRALNKAKQKLTEMKSNNQDVI